MLIPSNPNLPAYDFQRPHQMPADAMDALNILANAWGRRLASMLTIDLRVPTQVTLDRVTAQLYGDEMTNSRRSMVYTVFSGSLRGMVAVDLSVVTHIIDRLLGGDGQWSSSERELTDLEHPIWVDTCQRWAELFNQILPGDVTVRWNVASVEFQPAFVNFLNETDWTISSTYLVTMDTIRGQIVWHLPLIDATPLATSAARALGTDAPESLYSSRPEAWKHVKAITAPTQLVIGARPWNLGLLESLMPGAVIPLPTRIDDPLAWVVGPQIKGWGQVGTVNNRFALRLTEVTHAREVPSLPTPEPESNPGGFAIDV